MQSFYWLDLWVEPGGSRKHEAYFFASLDEIKYTLEADLENDAYHALIYGEHIDLKAYSHGKLTWELDLHPYLTFHVTGYPPFTCTTDGGDFEHVDLTAFPPENEEIEANRLETWIDNLGDEMFDHSATVEVEIDWDAMAIPELEGELAQDGEPVIFQDEGGISEVAYGFNDWWG